MLLEMEARNTMQNTIRFVVGLKLGEVPTVVDKQKSRIYYTL